jgi:hypothetical protein
MELNLKHINKEWQDADETTMHQVLEYHCKGVLIDIPACEQCSSLFGGESAFDYIASNIAYFLKIKIQFLRIGRDQSSRNQ